MNYELCITTACAQDQYARHAPIGRRLTHTDTVATHFVLPISEAQQASVSGLAAINTLIEEAFSHLGKRYRSGGKGPTAFDCSGFTSYVFKKLNHMIGASSRDQYVRNKPIKRNEMRRGDLVFFTSPRSGKNVGHVGIIVDVESKLLHALLLQLILYLHQRLHVTGEGDAGFVLSQRQYQALHRTL